MMDLCWQDAAACAKEPDLNLWLSDDKEAQQLARRICRIKCPVREQCLAYAQERFLKHGVYGGLTAQERRDLRHEDAKITGNHSTACCYKKVVA